MASTQDPSGQPGDEEAAASPRRGADERPSTGRDKDRDPGGAADTQQRQSIPITQHIGRVAVVVLAVLFGVFAVFNSQPVDFHWLFGESRVEIDATGERVGGGVPLIVLLVASLAIGLLLGAIGSWQEARRRGRREDGRQRS